MTTHIIWWPSRRCFRETKNIYTVVDIICTIHYRVEKYNRRKKDACMHDSTDPYLAICRYIYANEWLCGWLNGWMAGRIYSHMNTHRDAWVSVYMADTIVYTGWCSLHAMNVETPVWLHALHVHIYGNTDSRKNIDADAGRRRRHHVCVIFMHTHTFDTTEGRRFISLPLRCYQSNILSNTTRMRLYIFPYIRSLP